MQVVNNKKIAVLIICYNESKTIEKVKSLLNELPSADIYVYDNNSSDEIDRMAKKYEL